MDDAACIVWLRHLKHAKGKLGDSVADVACQEAWLNVYFHREGDYYFILETPAGIPVGTDGIYDQSGSSAESGRLIIRPEVPAVAATAIMSYDLAFGPMGLTELRATCVSNNLALQSLVRKFGFRRTKVEIGGRIIGGCPVDIPHFILTKKDWFECRERVLRVAKREENRVLAWEKMQLGKSQPWNETKN
jgi:RimJ/RimL family protein N-acetyltransferase